MIIVAVVMVMVVMEFTHVELSMVVEPIVVMVSVVMAVVMIVIMFEFEPVELFGMITDIVQIAMAVVAVISMDAVKRSVVPMVAIIIVLGGFILVVFHVLMSTGRLDQTQLLISMR